MRYYRFGTTTKCPSSCPMQADGQPFPCEHGIPYHLLADRVRVWVPQSRHDQAITSPDQLTDFLGFHSLDQVVSPRAKSVLETFRLDNDFRFIPADIVSWHTNECLGHYFYCPRPNILHHVISKERGEVVEWVGFVMSIRKWVIENERLPPLDMFVIEDSRWLVTEPVIQACLEHELTGWQAQAVWDTEHGQIPDGLAKQLSGYGPKLRRALRKVQRSGLPGRNESHEKPSK